MGGTLSSPLGSRPHHHHHPSHHGGGGVHVVHHNGHHHIPQSTSVCNHLFSPPDGAALYLPSSRQSVSHWPTAWQQRKNVHPEERQRERVLKIEHHSNGDYSRAPYVSPPSSLPYSATLSLSVADSNCNYNGGGSTVIPNLYSLAREERDAAIVSGRTRYDLVNNNNNIGGFVSPPCSQAATPLSPTHQPISRIGTRILDVVEKEARAAKDRFPSPPAEKEAFTPAVHASVEVRRRTVMHASTSDLLRGLGRFVVKKAKIDNIDSAHVVMWMRSVDRSLLLQGWQDIAFINPANLVFVFLLLRAVDDDDECLESTEGIHQWVLTCLYVAYSYMGNEISYPLKPFLIQRDKPDFWSKCVSLALEQSENMLLLNSSSSFFSQVFAELKKSAADF